MEEEAIEALWQAAQFADLGTSYIWRVVDGLEGTGSSNLCGDVSVD